MDGTRTIQISKKCLTLLSTSKPLSRSRRRAFPAMQVAIQLFMSHSAHSRKGISVYKMCLIHANSQKFELSKQIQITLQYTKRDCHIEKKNEHKSFVPKSLRKDATSETYVWVVG